MKLQRIRLLLVAVGYLGLECGRPREPSAPKRFKDTQNDRPQGRLACRSGPSQVCRRAGDAIGRNVFPGVCV